MACHQTVLTVVISILFLLLVPMGSGPQVATQPVATAARLTVLDNLSSNLSSSLLSNSSLSLTPPSTPVGGTLVDRGTLGDLSPLFWSIVGQTATNTGFHTDTAVGTLVNSTPIRFIRYGEGSDACDIANNTFYYFLNGNLTNSSCAYDVSAFKAWCYSLTPHCHSILTLPGEVKNASYVDRYEANYIVNTVHFMPDYWAIGNEPESWHHYNISWKSWKVNDNSKPASIDYSIVLNKSITSVRSVTGLSSAKFIGIQASSSSSSDFFKNVSRVAGSRIAAIAYHSYPDWNHSSTYYPNSVARFYQPLADAAANISGSIQRVRNTIANLCSNCSTLPIQLEEYNGGPSAGRQWMGPSPGGFLYTNATPYDSRFQGAVFTAASVAQAIEANVQTLTYFNLQSHGHNYTLTNFSYAISNDIDQRDPVATLYQSMFPSLQGKTVHNVAVRTTLGNVWAAMLTGGGDVAHPVSHVYSALLVVNANLNSSLSLDLSGVLSRSMWGTALSWDNTTSSPVSRWGSFNTTFTIPSQGILLLNGSQCSSCISAHLGAGSKPDGFAVSGTNNMTYVAESGAHLVVALNVDGSPTNVSIPTCGHPSQLAYSPATTDVYVTCASSSAVVAISPSNVVVQTITVGSTPGAIAYDPANAEILVANYGSNSVTAIAGVTVQKTIHVGTGPTSLTYDAANSYVYVANSQSSNLTILNATLVIKGNPATPANPVAVVVDPVGDAIVICNSSSSVRVFSGVTATHTIVLPPGSHPSAAAMAGGLVIIAEYSSNVVAVLSTTNWSVFSTVSSPAGPNAIAYDPTDGKLYVTCFLANSVLELYGVVPFANLVTGTLPVAVIWNSHYADIYVADYGSGDVWWSHGQPIT